MFFVWSWHESCLYRQEAGGQTIIDMLHFQNSDRSNENIFKENKIWIFDFWPMFPTKIPPHFYTDLCFFLIIQLLSYN